LITSNDKKNNGFWDQVSKHYNQNYPNGLTIRLARSLGMKWGTIKLDVAKFSGKYKIVQTLQEYGTNMKDKVQKTLGLYKSKLACQQFFSFDDCLTLIIVA
jgi:hypothetical protein